MARSGSLSIRYSSSSYGSIAQIFFLMMPPVFRSGKKERGRSLSLSGLSAVSDSHFCRRHALVITRPGFFFFFFFSTTPSRQFPEHTSTKKKKIPAEETSTQTTYRCVRFTSWPHFCCWKKEKYQKRFDDGGEKEEEREKTDIF